jgi:hypothetical protein
MGKQGLQTLYDGLLKAFGKDVPTLDIVKFYLETIRNRAIKDYKYAGGPDLKVGTDAKVDDKKIIVDMKDTTHLPEYKKVIATAQQDNKKRKQLAADWVNKTLLVRLDKYLSEIPDDAVDNYLKTLGKEAPEGGGDFKVGDSVLYKRDNWEKNKAGEIWDKMTDDEKTKPGEGKLKELIDNESVGIKVVKAIEGDVVRFTDVDWIKNTGDILGKVEAKAEGQEDLTQTLGEVKTKNPEAIKKLGDIAKLYQDPEANKDKIAEKDLEKPKEAQINPPIEVESPIIMLEGKVPEVTIKFSQKPEIPSEGKTITLQIKGENGISVRAEIARKNLSKQIEKMESFEEWVAALSGKMVEIAPDGVIELEGAGINVFEKKGKEVEKEKTAE